MRVLVLGATGDQGVPQVEALAAAGFSVGAACRDPARLGPLPSDAAPVHVDYACPETLRAAIMAHDAVFVTLPSSSFNDPDSLVRTAEHIGEFAAEGAARPVVFNTSMMVRDEPLGFQAHDVRLAMRLALARAGAPLGCVQPVIYMDNLLRGWAWPHIAREDTVVYPHREDLGVQWICEADVAALMVEVLRRPSLAGRNFTVGGPEVLTLPTVACVLSAVTGRGIRHRSQPIPEFCEQIRAAMEGRSSLDATRVAGELERIYRWYNESPEQPFRVDMREVLAELPVRLTPLHEWAALQRWR